MTTYIAEIVSELLHSKINLSTSIFIFPSKRAGFFLKKEIVHQNTQNIFSPKIVSIEEFIENIADLKIGEPIQLLFEFYEAYLTTNPSLEKESFEYFSSWAKVLLDDFNEIDRNLIDATSIFNYLKSIKDLEHWSLNSEQTELMENYLAFWNSLSELYLAFTERTTKTGSAHQGLVYREAANNLEHYIKANHDRKHIFVGFNALNNAEQRIIKELLENGNAEVFWDSDAYFMDQEHHSASLFQRTYKNQWKYYKTHEFKYISKNYEKPKEINIIGCSKSVGQTKYVGELLKTLSNEELENTALVLADEKLLLPILNSLPENVESVNITMGLPLKDIPALYFFEDMLHLHIDANESYYYKDIFQVLNHPLGKMLLPKTSNLLQKIINEKNLTQIRFKQILEASVDEEKKTVILLFQPQYNEISKSILHAKEVILHLREVNNVKKDPILLETLYKIHEVWNKIDSLNQKYKHIKTSKALLQIFKELTATTTLDFKGEPYKGLQILGILETRGLDFENIILVSVNEGILPAGKTNRSFITFDLKTQYKLPTHSEKDAIYTYHFYRLLHRASKIHVLYNNHTSGIQIGEKSRFLMQIQQKSPISHAIIEKIITPEITIKSISLKQINKTPEILERIKTIAAKGFSPSSLTTYIKNPMDFYTQYILKIKEVEEVEETVAANTLGTIVHDTLQNLLEPYLNQILTSEILSKLQTLANAEVIKQFSATFKEGNIHFGKNLIIFEMAKRYVQNFLVEEIKLVETGNEIVILQVEEKLHATIDFRELDFPVKIQGKVDRMDTLNGTLRIIDYKTGKVEQKELNLSSWEDLTTDYKYSKSFQVLAYALMSNSNVPIQNAQAGIISFKNLKSGFLPFTLKEGKKTSISQETLENFTLELKKIILEICNPKIPFTQKEIEDNAY